MSFDAIAARYERWAGARRSAAEAPDGRLTLTFHRVFLVATRP